ncbi:RNA polymerase sigma factor [Pedobacter sp. PWIIR3]
MKLFDSDAGDDIIWEAIQNSDERAFKLIFNRFLPTLLATAGHYLNDESTCENIVQDIFLNIWLRRESLDIKDFKSYFKACTRYEVYKVLHQRRKSNKIVFTDEPLENQITYSVNDGEENIGVVELKSQINRYLESLPKRCKEIFLLSRQENLSNTEIAARLDISKRSVENQITAALHHLRLNLKNYTPITTSVVVSLLLSSSYGNSIAKSIDNPKSKQHSSRIFKT